MRLGSSPLADGGGGGFLPLGRSAKKNNSKRSTILQHLLAGPHQQMLQNSSALEIKKRQAVAVRQAMHGMGARCGDGGVGSELQPETQMERARDRDRKIDR